MVLGALVVRECNIIICVDFDHTLSNAGYHSIGQPNKPLFNAFIKLKVQGHNIILWTCREDIQLQQAVDWYKEMMDDMDY